MRHYWLLGVTGLIILLYPLSGYIGLNMIPLKDELAYEALRREINTSLSGDLLNLSPARVVHLSGKMVWSGDGTASRITRDKFPFPLVEKTKFQYLIVMERECFDWDPACYRTEQIELTGQKTLVPAF